MAAMIKRFLILPHAVFAMAIFLMALAAPAAQAEDSPYDLYIAGEPVTSTNAADLTAIEGVSVGDRGHARFNPATNMLELQDATIANPNETAIFIDPVVYYGNDDLTITIAGECTLRGADGSCSAIEDGETMGICYGRDAAAALTIALVDGTSPNKNVLRVIPGVQGNNTDSCGIYGLGTLTMQGDGSVYIEVPPQDQDQNQNQNQNQKKSYALNLYGDLVLCDDISLYATGPESSDEDEADGGEASDSDANPAVALPRENTAGLCMHAPQATISLNGNARAWFSGVEAGFMAEASIEPEDDEWLELQIVASADWQGHCSFEGHGSMGGQAFDVYNVDNASITRIISTCGMLGAPDDPNFLSEAANYPEARYKFEDLAENGVVGLFPVFAVSFNANEGSGTMETAYWVQGWPYELPECTFTPPAGYEFLTWDKGAPGEQITMDSNKTLKATWLSASSVPQVTWERIAGATAPVTMQKIAAKAGKTKSAIVTTDSSYKDALAASALAGKCNGLVMMTKKGSLTPQTKTALKNAGVKNVYILGSTANVSANVEKQLKSGTGVTKVVRISATTPSQRAVAAAKYGGKKSDTVIIATQRSFQDALSIAPYSYVSKSPILYAETNKKLSNATMRYIKTAKYKKAIVVGGPLALPATVDAQLKACGITSVTRLAGTNAYRTSMIIADWTTGSLKNGNYEAYKGYAITYARFQPAATNRLKANNLAVSTGQNWLDALAGAALCGKKKSVLLLADAKTKKSNYTVASTWCKNHVGKSGITFNHAYILGGKSAVQAKVETALKNSTKVAKIYVIS